VSKPRVVNLMPRFIDSRQRKAAAGMSKALILGASEASVLTPIDTSTLLNSQYRKVEAEGSRIVGTVGYTADYALAVHDPDNHQTFRRASAEKEFLKRGFENAEPNIRGVITGAIKT
jgi:hypothetical protein